MREETRRRKLLLPGELFDRLIGCAQFEGSLISYFQGNKSFNWWKRRDTQFNDEKKIRFRHLLQGSLM